MEALVLEKDGVTARQGKYPDEVREPTTWVSLDTQQAVRRAEQRDLRGDVVAVLTGNRVIAADTE